MKTLGELYLEYEKLEKETRMLYRIWAQYEEEDTASWRAYQRYQSATERANEALKKFREACMEEEKK